MPSKLVPLGFEVGGRLARTRAQKGEVVKADQLLGQLDPEIADAQVAQAEAAVAAAEAQANIAADVADRNQKLQTEGSVSDVQSKSASANRSRRRRSCWRRRRSCRRRRRRASGTTSRLRSAAPWSTRRIRSAGWSAPAPRSTS